MLGRLSPRKGQTLEDARRQLDHALGVSGWAVPGREARAEESRDPGAPWWWQGSEDASQTFLSSMGVKL